MAKSKSEEMSSSPTAIERLDCESIKIRSLAYLIESQADVDAVPLDMTKINYGIGLLLTECSMNVKEIADEMEEYERKSHKNQKGPKPL